MAEEKIIERLMDFGFDREEAIAYLFLLRAGPCPARVLANKLGGNRMKAYRTLKVLQDKGIVEVTFGRPVKFVATPLNETLNSLIEEYRSQLSGMEESKKTILECW
ncbi:MAG: TrmB family transcriptional regulator, partial [Candidatus Methanomethylicaceae archaeon]